MGEMRIHAVMAFTFYLIFSVSNLIELIVDKVPVLQRLLFVGCGVPLAAAAVSIMSSSSSSSARRRFAAF